MDKKQESQDIAVQDLNDKVKDYFDNGYRLVQISCTKYDNELEVNYSFDKDYDLFNLRLKVPMEAEIPSISNIYWCAFIYENEMHDLFGLKVKGMAIDFEGTLYKTSVKAPFGNCN